MSKFANYLRIILDTKVSPSVFIFVLSSVICGVVAVMSLFSPEILNSKFAEGLVMSYVYWVWILFAASIGTFIGLFLKNASLLKVCSFTTFLMWLFGVFSYIIIGQWVALGILGLPLTLFFAYIYLASSLDILHRKAIRNFPQNKG